MQTPITAEQRAQRIASLQHSLALAEVIGATTGHAKRRIIRGLHHTDIRRSLGEESGVSNPHVDRQRKRRMKLRLEHTGAQRMMRRRQRDIFEGELDTERLLEAADSAFDNEFDMDIEPVGKEQQ